MQARIVLPLLSALGLATALLAASAPQGASTLSEHELDGCEVIISPIGQRKVPVSVMYEEAPGKFAVFEVTIGKTGLVAVTDVSASGLSKPLTAGMGKLVLTYDTTNKAIDVELFPAEGGPTVKWEDTLLRGTYDRLGKFEDAYSEYVRHPTDTTGHKKAIRIWVKNVGMQGGILLYDQ